MNHQNTKTLKPLSKELERIAEMIVESAYHVHKNLGPGLLESVYEACLAHELTARGLKVQRQVVVPILYDSVRLEEGFRIDLLVENLVIIELKAVDALLPVHKAQVLTYIKLSGLRLGFLINFNVTNIGVGTKRLIL